MTSPIDAIVAIHNAFRRDMAAIDAAALAAARGKPEFTAIVERFRFFNEVLVSHAHGEELAIFPALEEVAPSVAEAYMKRSPRAGCRLRRAERAVSAATRWRRRAPQRRSSSISTFTWPRKIRTSTASSESASPSPTRARRSASCPAPFPGSASRK